MHDIAKDTKRVQDIISKGRWDDAKMKTLTETMCKRTHDPEKIKGRARAAFEILGPDNIITNTFLERLRQLGMTQFQVDVWVQNFLK